MAPPEVFCFLRRTLIHKILKKEKKQKRETGHTKTWIHHRVDRVSGFSSQSFELGPRPSDVIHSHIPIVLVSSWDALASTFLYEIQYVYCSVYPQNVRFPKRPCFQNVRFQNVPRGKSYKTSVFYFLSKRIGNAKYHFYLT